MTRQVRVVAEGAGAGLVATVAMSAVLLAARRVVALGEPPPKRIADAALHALGEERPPDWLRNVSAVVGHFGFGMTVGVLFTLLHRLRPQPLGPIPRGIGFASIVWFASYQGWIPALGIMPPALRARPERSMTMLVAHWVYGATLGACIGRMTGDTARAGWGK
jgi:hypothetical protein